MLISNYLYRYKKALLALPKAGALTKDELLTDDFLMERSGNLEMYYAPHNEYINPSAKVVIVGITPGWTQMSLAMREAKTALQAGLGDEEVCRRAKEAARFAGTMRTHLVDMLDTLELHRYLNILTCGELFQDHRKLLHTTSLLRFPVFAAKGNYNGNRPGLMANPFLREMALSSIQQELGFLSGTLIIPLGKTVEHALWFLVREGKLDEKWCLWGFPHPSGANGHRQKQFAQHQEQMKNRIREISWL